MIEVAENIYYYYYNIRASESHLEGRFLRNNKKKKAN